MFDYKVRPIKSVEVTEWLQKKHYARRRTSIRHAYGLYENGILLAVATFGVGPGKNPFPYSLLEFNRLCLGENRPNLASFFVGQCFKLLPAPCVLISYADTNQGHVGYVYQATNWLYTGTTSKNYSVVDLSGKVHHSRTCSETGWKIQYGVKKPAIKPSEGTKIELLGKHRYIMILGSKNEKKGALAKMPWPILPNGNVLT